MATKIKSKPFTAKESTALSKYKDRVAYNLITILFTVIVNINVLFIQILIFILNIPLRHLETII